MNLIDKLFENFAGQMEQKKLRILQYCLINHYGYKELNTHDLYSFEKSIKELNLNLSLVEFENIQAFYLNYNTKSMKGDFVCSFHGIDYNYSNYCEIGCKLNTNQ